MKPIAIYDTEMQDIVDMAITLEDKQNTYSQLVNYFIRLNYSAPRVEAILNNYLDDMSNEIHKQEFNDFQAYRKECKAEAKRILGLEE